MIGEIYKTIIHLVGNKTIGSGVRFSEEESSTIDVNTEIRKLLKKSFQKDGLFQFYFEPILDLNPIYLFVKNIFNDSNRFVYESQNIARYLYEKSTHPKIKSGELWLLYLKNCEIDGALVDAICILKSETKDVVLQFKPYNEGFDIIKQEGLALNKIDKGCLIFNIHNEDGFICSVVDNGAKKGDEAKFWIDDFLHVRSVKNAYYNTKIISDAIVNYVNLEMPKVFNISKSDQANIVNKGVNELKKSTDIDVNDFKNKVFKDKSVKNDFDRYFDNIQVENNIVLNGNIEISKSAMRKVDCKLMTTIKLDDNFDIKIHNGENLIEKGYDCELDLNYYKLYFKKEK